MSEQNFKHLVFFDGQCGLCDHTVQFLLKADNRKQFGFAPLEGKTAAVYLKAIFKDIPQQDSLVLIENYQANARVYILGKGVLRICWLLGRWWKLIGWMAFLPSWLFDAVYRIVARNRHRFFGSDVCVLPSEENKSRFLE